MVLQELRILVETKTLVKDLPSAFALTMLGHAAGGAEFSFRNGSTLFGLDQVG